MFRWESTRCRCLGRENEGSRSASEAIRIIRIKLFLTANIVTTSKALVPSSHALVTSSKTYQFFLFLCSFFLFVGLFWCEAMRLFTRHVQAILRRSTRVESGFEGV